jgi:hypothetical protein
MKNFVSCCLLFFITSLSFAQINKEDCTFTKNSETFPLYGKVKVVEDYPDFTVKIVEDYPDMEVSIVNSTFADDCGEWKFVDYEHPDFTIKFVEDYPDITIHFTKGFPGIK